MSDFWDGIVSLVSPIANFASGLFTNSANKQQTSETNAANMLMNQQNIDFQKEENIITRQREDNAVQRRANDLVAAGLSKTLAAGSPASANALNAPNNSFAHQGARFEAPRFDFDYGSLKSNLAAAQASTASAENAPVYAQAEADKASAAKKDADTRALQTKLDAIKFAKEHGFNVEKFAKEYGLDLEKFLHQKSMDEKNYDLKKWVDTQSVYIDKQKLSLSREELDLEREKLDITLKDTMSQIEWRDWQQTYQKAELALDRNADKREAARLKLSLVEVKAKVENYLAQNRLSDAQVSYYQKQGKKITAEILNYAAETLHWNEETKLTMEKAITEAYNRSVAASDGGKTSDHSVTSSEAHQNALDRANQQNLAGTASMRQFFSIILFSLLPGGNTLKYLIGQ